MLMHVNLARNYLRLNVLFFSVIRQSKVVRNDKYYEQVPKCIVAI